MKKRIFIVSILAVVLVGVVIGVTTILSRNDSDKPLTAVEILNLGDKYLYELNFEQALVQFTKVIEIEPLNSRAYIGAAKAYVQLGEIDKAIVILQQGLEATNGDNEIQLMLDSLLSPELDPAPTPTISPTNPPTATPEPTQVPTPTLSAELSATPEPSIEPTEIPQTTVEPTVTPESTIAPTATPEPTQEPIPTEVAPKLATFADGYITNYLSSGKIKSITQFCGPVTEIIKETINIDVVEVSYTDGNENWSELHNQVSFYVKTPSSLMNYMVDSGGDSKPQYGQYERNSIIEGDYVFYKNRTMHPAAKRAEDNLYFVVLSDKDYETGTIETFFYDDNGKLIDVIAFNYTWENE